MMCHPLWMDICAVPSQKKVVNKVVGVKHSSSCF